jgi:hypothetical protein
MRNLTLSEMLLKFPLNDFKITGDFNKDIESYIEFKKIPPWQRNLDSELFVLPLFRLSFGKNIIVHTLTDGVIEKIKYTKIENMPNEIPNLLQQPFLIEGRRDKPLFDDIYSIGGFLINNEIILINKTITDGEPGLFCQHERTSFDGRNIDDINFVYNKNVNFDSSYKQARTRKETFAFVIILSLMLEAERTPLLIDNKKEKSNKKLKSKIINKETVWITRRIYIDKNIKYTNIQKDQAVFDKTDKQLKDVIVKGFLRIQHYGEGNSKTKWIYIDNYESKRWTKEKNKKIIVDIYDK